MTFCVLVDPPLLESLRQRLEELKLNRAVVLQPFTAVDELPPWPKQSKVLVCLADQQLRQLLTIFTEKQWHLGLLPHPDNSQSRKAFGYSNQLSQCLDDAEKAEPKHIDLLLANELPILRNIIIGNSFGFRPGGSISSWAMRFRQLWQSLKQLSSLTPSSYKMQTPNSESMTTAALGICVVEHGNQSVIGHHLLPDSAMNDGRCHAIIVAPRSVTELLRLIGDSLFARNRHTLPSCVGLIASSELQIESPSAIDYSHDGMPQSAESLQIKCLHKKLALLPGRNLELNQPQAEPKESRRLQKIPMADAAKEVAGKPLRWIAHASEGEFKELLLALRDNAKCSSIFVNLMLLSSALATVGLFANSSPVLIGAMLLAPLMGPIISMSMALVRQDETLLRTSARTLATGFLTSMGCAAILSQLIPIHQLTHEIEIRTEPNLLDLAVAVLSGIAGAYAHAKTAIAKSLAGVAISVALVPPLAAAGIALGWLSWPLMWGALLLFLTNLSGILLASSLTFFIMGFAPFTRAKHALLTTSLAVAFVSVPLATSFYTLLEKGRLQQQIEQIVVTDVQLNQIQIRSLKPLVVTTQLVSSATITDKQRLNIKQLIEVQLGQPVILETTSVLRME